MAIRVEPVHDAVGAIVHGVDLTKPLDDATFAAVKDAHLHHGVIVFRDQPLTPAQHIAFARRWGELGPAPVVNLPGFELPSPEMLAITNEIGADGKIIGAGAGAGFYWHIGDPYLKRPYLGTVMHGVLMPSGGDLLFSGLTAAYEALPKDKQKAYARLRVIHRPFDTAQAKSLTPVPHPLVRTHPETGRQALFCGGMAASVEGLSEAEGKAIIDEVNAWSYQPRFVYTHTWRTGDVLFWDDRCTVHLPTPFDPNFPRRMHRVWIRGDEPFYRE